MAQHSVRRPREFLHLRQGADYEATRQHWNKMVDPAATATLKRWLTGSIPTRDRLWRRHCSKKEAAPSPLCLWCWRDQRSQHGDTLQRISHNTVHVGTTTECRATTSWQTSRTTSPSPAESSPWNHDLLNHNDSYGNGGTIGESDSFAAENIISHKMKWQWGPAPPAQPKLPHPRDQPGPPPPARQQRPRRRFRGKQPPPTEDDHYNFDDTRDHQPHRIPGPYHCPTDTRPHHTTSYACHVGDKQEHHVEMNGLPCIINKRDNYKCTPSSARVRIATILDEHLPYDHITVMNDDHHTTTTCTRCGEVHRARQKPGPRQWQVRHTLCHWRVEVQETQLHDAEMDMPPPPPAQPHLHRGWQDDQ